MSYCQKCGGLIEGNNAAFCTQCGNPVPAASPPFQPAQHLYANPSSATTMTGNLIQIFAGKVKTRATIWLINGVWQVVIGLINICIGIYLYLDWENGIINIVIGIACLIEGIVNIVLPIIRIYPYGEYVLHNPVGIVKKCEPIEGCLADLLYQFFLGGIFGLLGSIYSFTTRSFVLSNKMQFLEIENHLLTNTGDGTVI